MTNDPNETNDLEGQPVERAADETAVLPVRAKLTGIPGGIPDLDAPVDALRARIPAEEPLRVRFGLQLYDPERATLYFQWPKVVFTLELATAEDAVALREHLQAAIEQFVEARR